MTPTPQTYPLLARGKFATILAIVICTIATQSGCHVLGRFNRQGPPPPVILNETNNLDQLLHTLNAQSSKVNQIKTDVQVSMKGAPTMRGTLSVERPKRMRLKASVAGISAIDLGSNDDRFWIWTQVALPGQPPTLMYARHIEFETSPIRRQIPIDPAWLIDGLGFAEFRSDERHEGPFNRPNDTFLEIQTFRQTATGQNIRVCVIDPRTGLILQQSFYDQRGNLIAYLNAQKHEFIEDKGVSLPKRLDLFMYDPQGQQTKLTVTAGEYSINSIYGDPERLWSMPNPAGINKIDLSTVQPIDSPQSESAYDEASLSYQRRQPTSNVRPGMFRR